MSTKVSWKKVDSVMYGVHYVSKEKNGLISRVTENDDKTWKGYIFQEDAQTIYDCSAPTSTRAKIACSEKIRELLGIIDVEEKESVQERAGDMSCCLWFIKKIGNLERARRTFEAVMVSLK